MKTCGGNPGAISCTAEAECRGSLHERGLAGDNACEKKGVQVIRRDQQYLPPPQMSHIYPPVFILHNF